MKKIKLVNRDIYALVDDDDYDFINQLSWKLCLSKNKKVSYAVHWYPTEGKKKGTTISMHRVLMGVKGCKLQVDHKDGNGLNN